MGILYKNNAERLNKRMIKNIAKKKLFLFDIDGTIAVGNTLYEGSADLFAHIEAMGGAACFITNNSTKSNADYVKKFADCFHLQTDVKQFATAGYVTQLFMQEHFPDKKIFVLGTASYIAELKKCGLRVTETPEENISCVLVAYDSELTYEKLTKTCKVLSTMDVPFYATNPDLCCPIDFGFIPDCGSICNMLTASTGKKPIYLGKPAPEMVYLCEKEFGFSGEETIVVGDRLYTDILCGINAGVDTCVVYTGEATPEEVASSDYKPSYCFDTIKDFYKALL